MIELSGLARTYPGGAGVHDVRLHAPAGSVYALVGPNGSGKTTTLAVLTGHLFAKHGQLTLHGNPITLHRHALRPGMASIAYDPVLDPNLSAWEWLGYASLLRGIAAGTDALAWADRLLIEPDTLDQPISTLSDGNRRKVALWTGFQLALNVLVLDEPLTALDPPAISAFEAAVRAYTSEGGTVVLSTHLLPQAERLATHVGMLVAGRTIAEGTLQQVCGNHSLEDRFLAALR